MISKNKAINGSNLFWPGQHEICSCGKIMGPLTFLHLVTYRDEVCRRVAAVVSFVGMESIDDDKEVPKAHSAAIKSKSNHVDNRTEMQMNSKMKIILTTKYNRSLELNLHSYIL